MGEIGQLNDSHTAPEWLTDSYLEPILQKNKKDAGLRINDLCIKPATAKGENYASVMTRVKVEFVRSGARSSETEYYIVKTTYESNPVAAAIFAGYNASDTEMFVYEQVLPQLTSLLREVDDQDKLFAETVYVDYEHSAIIFEDLAVSKFVMADRLAGMDLSHTQLALKKLAKMHATAAVFNERNPSQLTKLDHGIFNRHTQAFAPMFTNLMAEAAAFARACPELGNEYHEKLLKLKQKIMEYTTRVYDPLPQQFNTLVHGDFWVNNMLMRYGAAQQPLDVILVDFQFCTWSSPAVDLHYFFNTSIRNELRFHRQDELVQYYHQVLVETLQALNFAGYVPTLRQLVLQLEQGRFMAVTASLTCQAIMINDQTADADFNSLILEDERGHKFRKLLYANKKFQENVKRILPIFNRCGLLDVSD